MGANAQTSVPTFTAGEILTAANMNISAGTGVPVFATTADRDAAFGGTGEKTLAEGQICYVEAAPNKIMIYDGSTWVSYDVESTAYTPTLTNVTLGNGTISGVYQRLGTYVVFGFQLILGSTTSVSGTIGISLPFTATSGGNSISYMNVGMNDTGTNTFNGIGIIAASATKVDIFALAAGGTYTSIGTSSTNATTPFTWTNTDQVYGTGIYRYI